MKPHSDFDQTEYFLLTFKIIEKQSAYIRTVVRESALSLVEVEMNHNKKQS
jgi:hypothetical protein